MVSRWYTALVKGRAKSHWARVTNTSRHVPNTPSVLHGDKQCHNEFEILKLHWILKTPVQFFHMVLDLELSANWELFWTLGTTVDQYKVKGAHQWQCFFYFFYNIRIIVQVIALFLSEENFPQNLKRNSHVPLNLELL